MFRYFDLRFYSVSTDIIDYFSIMGEYERNDYIGIKIKGDVRAERARCMKLNTTSQFLHECPPLLPFPGEKRC